MEHKDSELDILEAREAWGKFCSKGTATPQAAKILQVGLKEYLDVFKEKFLGERGYGEACKLVLGGNGEGKSHFLYCIREIALKEDHLVAMVEAKNVGAAMSPFVFGQELLTKLDTPASGKSDEDENNLIRLLRESVRRKQAAISQESLDPDELLPEWADGFRTKNLLPYGLAQSIADGLISAKRDDIEGLLTAVSKISFHGAKLSKDQQQIAGANLLKSIVKIPRMLGFRSLVLLIDEAELAIEKAGSAKRRAFLTFLRFVNDHMARGDMDSSVIMIACTDDFWPNQFEEYAALKGRLEDPGFDNFDARGTLTFRSLANKNKIWVRELFRGKESDYITLGEGLLQIATKVLDEVDINIQRKNVEILSHVASSSEVNPWVKRPFVKALAQTIQDQIDNGQQVVVSNDDARSMFNLLKNTLDVGEVD